LVRFSFPSGHTTTAFAAAGLFVLGFDLRRMSVLPIGLAALVGTSRMVAGVHWPIDVLAGAGGGWLAAAVAIRLAGRPTRWRPALETIAVVTFFLSAVGLVVGHDTGYPQAMWFERVIGLACLVVFGLTFAHPRTPNPAVH
jgi:hypothetical protein